MKYLGSIRGVLERASARETAVRVAAGALAKQLLAEFGITAFGYVVELGGLRIEPVDAPLDQLRVLRDQSAVYGLNPQRDDSIKALIDAAGKDGDTLGGIVEVRVDGLPFGLGTHAKSASASRQPAAAARKSTIRFSLTPPSAARRTWASCGPRTTRAGSRPA
jgi:chorismate synthase